MYASEQEMAPLNTRRDLFLKAIVAALVPVLGVVSPAMAETTYGTSGATTQGGDNDTRNDTKADTVTDSKTDPTQDTRQDP